MSDAGRGRRSTGWSYLGRLSYPEAESLQATIRRKLQSGSGGEALLLLEHDHVYTVGRNASREELLLDPRTLAERGVSVHESDRGGKLTYHGPGQLVGYPVVDLRPDRRDVRRYVNDLLEVVIRTLADFGVVAHARHQPETGVWVGERKIGSVGVHLSRWVTTHGFAVNITTDLSYFDGIVPCGLRGVEMCSLHSLTAASPALSEVARICARHFAEVFERELQPLAEGALVP